MKFIRSVHPYGFRSGEWAEIVGALRKDGERGMYLVRFQDETIDHWLIDDPSDKREFSDDPEVMWEKPQHRWEVAQVNDYDGQLEKHLAERWEPYAATYDNVTRQHFIYLRRQVLS